MADQNMYDPNEAMTLEELLRIRDLKRQEVSEFIMSNNFVMKAKKNSKRIRKHFWSNWKKKKTKLVSLVYLVKKFVKSYSSNNIFVTFFEQKKHNSEKIWNIQSEKNRIKLTETWYHWRH